MRRGFLQALGWGALLIIALLIMYGIASAIVRHAHQSGNIRGFFLQYQQLFLLIRLVVIAGITAVWPLFVRWLIIRSERRYGPLDSDDTEAMQARRQLQSRWFCLGVFLLIELIVNLPDWFGSL